MQNAFLAKAATTLHIASIGVSVLLSRPAPCVQLALLSTCRIHWWRFFITDPPTCTHERELL